MMLWLLLLRSACFSTAAVVCPVAECKALNEQICGMTTNGKVYVNSNPCPTEMTCSLSSLLSWSKTTANGEFACIPAPAQLTNTTLPPLECEEPDKLREFKSGKGIVDCVSDEDCELEDGSIIPGSCQCSLRTSGKGLCVPDLSHEIYEQYWEDCDGDVLENTDLEFWSFYISQWVYLESDLACTSYFQEVDTFTSLYITYRNSVAATVRVAAVFLLLSSY